MDYVTSLFRPAAVSPLRMPGDPSFSKQIYWTVKDSLTQGLALSRGLGSRLIVCLQFPFTFPIAVASTAIRWIDKVPIIGRSFLIASALTTAKKCYEYLSACPDGVCFDGWLADKTMMHLREGQAFLLRSPLVLNILEKSSQVLKSNPVKMFTDEATTFVNILSKYAERSGATEFLQHLEKISTYLKDHLISDQNIRIGSIALVAGVTWKIINKVSESFAHSFITKETTQRIILPILRQFEKWLDAQSNKLQSSLNSIEKESRQSGIAKDHRDEGPFRSQLSSNKQMLKDLRRCISKVELDSQGGKNLKEVLKTVSQIMGKYPAWIGNKLNLNMFNLLNRFIDEDPTLDPASESETIEEIMSQIQQLERNSNGIHVDWAKQSQFSQKKVVALTSCLVTYKIVMKILGTPPNWISLPSFSQIATKSYKHFEGQDMELVQGKLYGEIASEIRAMIGNAKHVFFPIRWGLWFASFFILWSCQLLLSWSLGGLYRSISQFAQTAQDTKNKTITTAPLEGLKAACEGIYASVEYYGKNAAGFNSVEAAQLEYVRTNQTFLQNLGSFNDILKTFGSRVVDKFIFSFQPTNYLREADSALIRLAGESLSLITLIANITMLPLRVLLWTINHTFILIAEKLTRLSVHLTAKIVLKWWNVIADLLNMTRNGIFGEPGQAPSTIIIKVFLDLLKEIDQMIDRPPDPHGVFSRLHASPVASQALGDALLSLLKAIDISQYRTADDIQRFTSGQLHAAPELLRSILGTAPNEMVVKSLQTLLTRSYHLLMTPTFLHQQTHLIFKAIESAMLSEDKKNLDPTQRREKEKEAVKDQQRLNLYLNKVVSKVVRLVHSAASKTTDDLDGPIKKNVEKIKKLFLNRTSGLIHSWKSQLKSVLSSDAPRSVEILGRIYKELLSTWHQLESRLLKMEANGSIGSASLDMHKKHLEPSITILKGFQEKFLHIHNSYLRSVMSGPYSVLEVFSRLQKDCLAIHSLIRTSRFSNYATIDLSQLDAAIASLKLSYKDFLREMGFQKNYPVPANLETLKNEYKSFIQELDPMNKALKRHVLFEHFLYALNHPGTHGISGANKNESLEIFVEHAAKDADYKRIQKLSAILQSYLKKALPLWDEEHTEDQKSYQSIVEHFSTIEKSISHNTNQESRTSAATQGLRKLQTYLREQLRKPNSDALKAQNADLLKRLESIASATTYQHNRMLEARQAADHRIDRPNNFKDQRMIGDLVGRLSRLESSLKKLTPVNSVVAPVNMIPGFSSIEKAAVAQADTVLKRALDMFKNPAAFQAIFYKVFVAPLVKD